MTEPADGDWLAWARRLRAIAQTGLAYSRDGYDLERFEEVNGIAERMLAAVTGAPPSLLREIYLPERGYPTPKVDVRAGVFQQAGTAPPQVLLVRESSDGCWSLPGGWADEQESPRASIEREVHEESGYRVRAAKLAFVRDRSLHPYTPPRLEHVYKLFFVCDLEGGAPGISLETTAARFFPLDRLPELSPGRTLAADIELLARHDRERSLPVGFD